MPKPLRIEPRDGPIDGPSLAADAADQRRHEAEPGREEATHPIEAHDLFGRAQRRARLGAVLRLPGQGCGPKERSKKASQLPPMMAATSGPEKPTRCRPAAMLGKSRLSRNQSGCDGKPGSAAEPSP